MAVRKQRRQKHKKRQVKTWNKEVMLLIEANDGVRIDKYLALLMEECSRSYIQKIIGDQSVCVNGKSG